MLHFFSRSKPVTEEPVNLKERASDLLSRSKSHGNRLEELIDEIAEYFEALDQGIIASFVAPAEVIDDYQKAARAQLVEHSSTDRKFQSVHETQVSSTLHSLHSAFQLLKSLKRLHAQSPPALASAYRRFTSASSQKLQIRIEGIRRLRQVLPETIRTQTPPSQRMIYFPMQVIHRTISSLESRKTRFGSYGLGPMQFIDPRGLAIHPITGDIYICQSSSPIVRRFSPDLVYIESINYGVTPRATGYVDIAISNDGRTMVLIDSARGRVEFVEYRDGTFPDITESIQFKTKKVNLGRATFDEFDYLYVSSPENRIIRKYTKDGKLLLEIAETSSFQFQGHPEGLLVNSDGELFVSSRTTTIQVLSAQTGKYLRNFKIDPIQGSSSISFGPDGTIMITDSSLGQIMFYLPNGRMRRIFDVYRACSAKFDIRGNLVVVQSSDSNSVEVF